MRGPGTSTWRALVTVPLLVGPLAACGGSGEQPATLPPRDRPSSASAAPSGTTAGPAAAVEQAVRTYYARLTDAAQSNDTAGLADLVTPACPCAQAITVIRRNARKGHTTPDAAFTVDQVQAHDVGGKLAAAEVQYTASAYDVLDSAGGVVSRISAHRSHLDLSLVRTPAGSWVITNVTDLED